MGKTLLKQHLGGDLVVLRHMDLVKLNVEGQVDQVFSQVPFQILVETAELKYH